MAHTRNPPRDHTWRASDTEMPPGQAPALRRPMTAVERRNAENEQKSNVIKEALLAAIGDKRGEIEGFLGVFGISFDLFLAGLLVFLAKQQREQPDFFVNLHIGSFVEALTRVAMNGLIADGKEAAIAAYKDSDLGQKVAQPMFMRDGFVKVLWRTGMLRAINDQVVTMAEYEAGRFDYEEGDQGYIRHRLDLNRKDTDPVAAAYCVIELVGGGIMREVVPKDELQKIAGMSKSPARKSWQHQMHRKAAIRRIMGKMPREANIERLLQDDEAAYDLKRAGGRAGDDETPGHAELFSNRPIRRKKTEPLAIAEGADQVIDVSAPKMDEAELVGERRESEDSPAPQQRQSEADQGEFVLQAVITTKNGLQQFPAAQAEFWFGDLQQKMKHLEGEPLRAFWGKNRGYIEEAGRNGYAEYAMKLLELADERGLIEKAADRG